MKTIKSYLYIWLVIWAALGCSDDTEPVYTPGTVKSSATFVTPVAAKEYRLLPENRYEVMDLFEWTPSEYPVPVGMQYTLEMDLPGNDFESPVRLGVTTDNELEFVVNDFNSLVSRLGVEPEERTAVELRIRTSAFGGEEGITPLPDFPVITSQTLTIYVTTYEADEANELYMIGQDFGGWDWSSDGVVKMIPVFGKPGEFWCINYFTAGNGFKWAPARLWMDDFSALDESIGFSVEGGDAHVAADGLYMVYVNRTEGRIAIEEAKVYGIGDAFGEWTEGLYPFRVSGRVVTGVTNQAGNLRMYAASSIATSDWWTREFILMDGQIIYREDGPDQDAVAVPAGATVTLDFAAGTGSIN